MILERNWKMLYVFDYICIPGTYFTGKEEFYFFLTILVVASDICLHVRLYRVLNLSYPWRYVKNNILFFTSYVIYIAIH